MKYLTKLSILVLVTILLSSCDNNIDKFSLEGAGATFPYPLYSAMFDEFYSETGVSITYQAIGSAAGIRRIMYKNCDFGASDFTLSDDQMNDMDEILHIPACLGAVSICYNLNIQGTLNLDADIISKIYMHDITKWNDKQIQDLNPDISLPELNIIPIKRLDGSGTTHIFTEYLSESYKPWNKSIGITDKIEIENIEAKGNQGMVDKFLDNIGSIAYVEMNYALSNNMPIASVRNRSGFFINPSTTTLKNAAKLTTPITNKTSLTATPVADGYPLTSFSWLLIYKDLTFLKNKAKAHNLVDFVNWMTHEGQDITKRNNYAQLPDEIIKQIDDKLKTITFKNKRVLQ